MIDSVAMDRRQEDRHIGELIASVRSLQNELSIVRNQLAASEIETINRIISVEQSVIKANILMATLDGIDKGKTIIYSWIAAIAGFILGYFKDTILSFITGK